MQKIRIAILGFGKIAADQHVPAIQANPRFELVASSSRSGKGVGQVFTDWRELIRNVDVLDAVAITTPVPLVTLFTSRPLLSREPARCPHLLHAAPTPESTADASKSRLKRSAPVGPAVPGVGAPLRASALTRARVRSREAQPSGVVDPGSRGAGDDRACLLERTDRRPM